MDVHKESEVLASWLQRLRKVELETSFVSDIAQSGGLSYYIRLEAIRAQFQEKYDSFSPQEIGNPGDSDARESKRHKAECSAGSSEQIEEDDAALQRIPHMTDASALVKDTWERIHLGSWKDLHPSWRQLYMYSILFNVGLKVMENIKTKIDSATAKQLCRDLDQSLIVGHHGTDGNLRFLVEVILNNLQEIQSHMEPAKAGYAGWHGRGESKVKPTEHS